MIATGKMKIKFFWRERKVFGQQLLVVKTKGLRLLMTQLA